MRARTAVQQELLFAVGPEARRVDDWEAWLEEVRPAYERAARSGREWTTYEVARAEDLPDPPDPATHWGRLMTLLHAEGLIEPAGWATSLRPTVHSSGVRRWRGTGAARDWEAAA
ncbi:hypothetical protein [Streptomyces xiamenensis]|uniref:hypothetical protein n=1 Tax=Streptomyces xiamenensis TaxID=408015 RepID=UPI003D7369C7